MTVRTALSDLSKLLATHSEATVDVFHVEDLVGDDPGDPLALEAVGIMVRGLTESGIRKIPSTAKEISRLFSSRLEKENR